MDNISKFMNGLFRKALGLAVTTAPDEGEATPDEAQEAPSLNDYIRSRVPKTGRQNIDDFLSRKREKP